MALSIKNTVFTWWRYVAIGLVLLAIGGYFYIKNVDSHDATFTAISGDFIRKVNVSGTVVAAKDVNLGFSANGRIAGVYAKVGQRVFSGTVLAETDNGDLVAGLAKARADLATLLAGTRSEEIAVASALVANAESSLVDAIQNAYTVSDDAVHNRADSLFTSPLIDPRLSFNVSNITLKNSVERGRSEVESVLMKWYDLVSKLSSNNASDLAELAQSYLFQVSSFLADANSAINQGLPDTTTTSAALSSYATSLAAGRTNANNAATTLTSAITTLDSAVKNLKLKQAGSTKDSIVAQEAVVASAQSALAKTYVTAPFTGVVTRMDAKIGEIVSPTTSLISMQSDGIFQIETYIPEVVISGVAVGNSATTTLDAYGSSVEFPATVIAVDPAETIKDGVPAYKTTLSFLSADMRIRSGMTVNAVINIGTLHNAIVIPIGAVGNKDGMSYVSVLSKEKIEDRTVVTGISPALGRIEILSGLSDGEVVLLTPSS
jgi:HlyD family secretion protein